MVQTFPNKRTVDLYIADSGLGIPNTLRSRYPDLTDAELLVKSLEYKVTNGTGQGAGLYYTKRFIEENEGAITIYSPSNLKLTLNSRSLVTSAFPSWYGTLIHITANIDRMVSARSIFGNNVPAIVEDYILDGSLW